MSYISWSIQLGIVLSAASIMSASIMESTTEDQFQFLSDLGAFCNENYETCEAIADIVVNDNSDGTAITIDPNASDKFLINIAGSAGTDGKDNGPSACPGTTEPARSVGGAC